MANWYFDAVNGLDANPGTIGSPKQWWENFSQPTAAAGDTFFFYRGTTQVFVNGFTQLKGGTSEALRCRYAVYGPGSSPVTWTKPSGNGNMVLNLSNALKYIDVEDMVFDAGGVCLNAIYCAIQGASDAGFLRFYRCHFKNATSSGFNTGTESLKTGVMSGLVFEDCEFYGNGGHGLILSGVNTSFVRRCKFYRNGSTLSTGGHGFSSGAAKTTASSGWTVEATDATNKTWKRTLAANETTVYYVKTSVTGFVRLRLTTNTQSAPSSGEFGFTGGVLYINVNSTTNPSSQGVIYAWKRAYALTVEDCEAYENYWATTSSVQEGHGFAFDDWADDSFFNRNLSYNNQGAGFSVNRGDRNTLRSNVAFGNWSGGVIVNPCDGVQVIHNSFFSNNASNSRSGNTDAEVKFNGNCKSASVSNNILISSVAYGVASESTDTVFSGSNNCVIASASEKTAFLTATSTTAPALDFLYRPTVTSIKTGGTFLGGNDFYGKEFPVSSPIGAVASSPATRSATSRSVSSRTVESRNVSKRAISSG